MMNEVIILERRLTVDVCTITNKKYFGVQVGMIKGFIQQTNYGRGHFKVMCPYNITTGNYYEGYMDDYLIELVERIIKDGNKVYQFDTYNELFKWLAE